MFRAAILAITRDDRDFRRELAALLRVELGDVGDERLDTAAAAARLDLHPDTLARFARQGRIPGATKAGCGWRFPARDLTVLPISDMTDEQAARVSPARPVRRLTAPTAASAIRRAAQAA